MPVPTALRAALVAAPLLVLPATASAAPSMLLSSGCYVQASDGSASQSIAAKLDGLAAGQSAAIRITRQGAAIGTGDAAAADAAGSLVNGLKTWAAPLGSKVRAGVPAVVEAFDPATGTAIASAPTQIANLDWSVKSSKSGHEWKVQGLTALTGQSTYYVHYFNHGKYKGRMSLGKGSGPCGFVKKTTSRLTPFAKLGRYDFQIETSKKYDPDAPYLSGRVVVTHKFL